MRLPPGLLVLPLLLASATQGSGLTAQADAPRVILDGVDRLRTLGADSAVAFWTRDWPGTDVAAKRSQLVQALQELSGFAGRCLGADVVRTFDISPHLRQIYLVLLFEHQPVYAVFTVYRPGEAPWRTNWINFHTDAKQVFPPALLGP